MARREALERGTRCPDCDVLGVWQGWIGRDEQDGLAVPGVQPKTGAVVCPECGQIVSRRVIPRAAVCGTKPIALQGGVKVVTTGRRTDGSRRAGLRGVYRCNKPWICPECARAQAASDADTLHACNMGWRGFVRDEANPHRWVLRKVASNKRKGATPARRGGSEKRARNGVYLLTLTIPHHEGLLLEPMRRAAAAAYRRCINGAPYRRVKRRYGIKSTLRRLEVTTGPSGWHPHIHALLFTDRRLSSSQIESLREWYFVRWSAAVEHSGYARPSKQHGVDLIVADKGGRYLAKMGLKELAGDAPKVARCAECGDYKGSEWNGERRACVDCGHEVNRTLWQVLEDLAEHPTARDRRTWRTYVAGIRGARRLTWGRENIAADGTVATLREVHAEHVRKSERARCACHGIDPECNRCGGTGRYDRRRLTKQRAQEELELEHTEYLTIPQEVWALRYSRDAGGLAELVDAYERGDKYEIEALLGRWMAPAKIEHWSEDTKPTPEDLLWIMESQGADRAAAYSDAIREGRHN